jgi:osmotically-inducible protein OsmY
MLALIRPREQNPARPGSSNNAAYGESTLNVAGQDRSRRTEMVTRERNFHGLKPESDLESPNHASLETKVANALSKDGSLDPSDIVVVDMNGEITLRGAVSSLAEAQRATEVARSIVGVGSVINALEIVVGNG